MILWDMHGHSRSLFCRYCWKWQFMCWFYYLTYNKVQAIMLTNENDGRSTFTTYSVSAPKGKAIRFSDIERDFSRAIGKPCKLVGGIKTTWFPPDTHIIEKTQRENQMREMYPT